MVSIYFAEGVASKIAWRITRGDTDVPVDFGTDGVDVSLISNDGVIHVDSFVADDVLIIPLSSIRPLLPPNVYSLKARWRSSSNPDYPSVAFVKDVFAVTKYPYEATYYAGSTITIKVKSSVDPPQPEIKTYAICGWSEAEPANLDGGTPVQISGNQFTTIEGENYFMWFAVPVSKRLVSVKNKAFTEDDIVEDLHQLENMIINSVEYKVYSYEFIGFPGDNTYIVTLL